MCRDERFIVFTLVVFAGNDRYETVFNRYTFDDCNPVVRFGC